MLCMLCMMQVCVVLDRQSVCVEALPGTMSVFKIARNTVDTHKCAAVVCTLALVQCS